MTNTPQDAVERVEAKLKGLRTLCKSSGQPFYVELLDEALADLTQNAKPHRCPKCGKEWPMPAPLPNGVDEADVLDAFYCAVPEMFGSCLGDDRHATAAASIPLSTNDIAYLRGIRAAHNIIRSLTKPDEEMVGSDVFMAMSHGANFKFMELAQENAPQDLLDAQGDLAVLLRAVADKAKEIEAIKAITLAPSG